MKGQAVRLNGVPPEGFLFQNMSTAAIPIFMSTTLMVKKFMGCRLRNYVNPTDEPKIQPSKRSLLFLQMADTWL